MTYPDSSRISSIYRSISLEKNDLSNSLSYIGESVGFSTANANTYQIPVAALDKVILGKIDLINTKKQEVVDLLTSNFNSGTCGIGSSAVDVVSNIVIVGSASTFLYDCNPTCSIGVSAVVRKDVLYAWNYPALENYDVTSGVPQEDGTYSEVTTSNIGFGKTSVFFNDQSDPVGIMTTSELIGYYYPIVETGGSCTTLINQVTALENEIVSIRSEINSIISSINILKDKKTEEQLTAYYEYQSQEDSVNKVSELSTVLDVLDTYKTEILDYENTLPSTYPYQTKSGNYTYSSP